MQAVYRNVDNMKIKKIKSQKARYRQNPEKQLEHQKRRYQENCASNQNTIKGTKKS